MGKDFLSGALLEALSRFEVFSSKTQQRSLLEKMMDMNRCAEHHCNSSIMEQLDLGSKFCTLRNSLWRFQSQQGCMGSKLGNRVVKVGETNWQRVLRNENAKEYPQPLSLSGFPGIRVLSEGSVTWKRTCETKRAEGDCWFRAEVAAPQTAGCLSQLSSNLRLCSLALA